jgi:uncharacterized membrane protein
MKNLTTRRVVRIAIIAALYAVLTVALSPISYGPIQLRVSEALKVLVLFDPWMVIGIGIGTFFANLASPFAGPWELIWMPLTDMLGGLIAWALFRLLLRQRLPVIPMVVYAITTGFAVGLMLTMLQVGEFWPLGLGVAASELIILVLAVPLMLFIEKQLQARGIGFNKE